MHNKTEMTPKRWAIKKEEFTKNHNRGEAAAAEEELKKEEQEKEEPEQHTAGWLGEVK